MERELLHSHEQQGAAPAIALTVEVFRGTPWETALQDASEHRPAVVQGVFKGAVGLYWAHAEGASIWQDLERPTKALLTRLTLQQQPWAWVEQLDEQDSPELFEVVQHFNAFVGTWASAQDAERIDSPEALAEALHTDAAEQFADKRYWCGVYDKTLRTVAQFFADGDQKQHRQTYNALTRHFTASLAAPPVGVVDKNLERVLSAMRERYGRICTTPGYVPDFNGQRLLLEILGANERSSPVSEKELLLGTTATTERKQLRTAIAGELDTLIDPELIERSTNRGKTMRIGTLALRPDETTYEDTALWRLVERIKISGDTAGAISELYQQTYPAIYQSLLAKLGSVEAAEDIASQVYVEALQLVRGISRQEYGVDASLLGIAHTLSADYLYTSKGGQEISACESPQPRPETTGHAPDSAWLGPEGAVAHKEMQQLIHKALGSLASDGQRECIRLRFIDNYSVEEAARRMGLSVGATKVLQHRATVRMRKFFATSL